MTIHSNGYHFHCHPPTAQRLDTSFGFYYTAILLLSSLLTVVYHTDSSYKQESLDSAIANKVCHLEWQGITTSLCAQLHHHYMPTFFAIYLVQNVLGYKV